MKAVTSSVASAVLLTIVASAIYSLVPGARSLTLHAYVFAIGAVALVAAVRVVSACAPPQRAWFDAALARAQPPTAGVSQLERLQREVTIGCASDADFQQHLLPKLREIAAALLAQTGRTPGPDTLGRWWDVLRPDRTEPEDRFAPGISLPELKELVADLSRLS